MNRFAASLESAVRGGFEAQAAQHGADVHRRAVEMRSRDPLATFLIDTFTRQVRDRGQRAATAARAGDHATAKALAESAMMAETNLETVRAAVEG